MSGFRKIWEWITHTYTTIEILQYFGAIKILASFIMTFGVGMTAFLQSFSPLWIFLIALFTFTLTLHACNEITFRRLKKRIPMNQQGRKSEQGEKGEQKKKDEISKEQQGEIKRLLDIAQSDRQDLSKSLCIANAHGQYTGFDSTPSCITFYFNVFNGSVFHISADSNIEGHIIFLGKELNRPPQLKTEWLFTYVSRGHMGPLTINQYLEPEEVKSMLELKKRSELMSLLKPESFNFEKVKLWITADDSAIKNKKYLLPLGKIPFV